MLSTLWGGAALVQIEILYFIHAAEEGSHKGAGMPMDRRPLLSMTRFFASFIASSRQNRSIAPSMPAAFHAFQPTPPHALGNSSMQVPPNFRITKGV